MSQLNNGIVNGQKLIINSNIHKTNKTFDFVRHIPNQDENKELLDNKNKEETRQHQLSSDDH